MKETHTPAPWKIVTDRIDNDESPDYLRIVSPHCNVASGILIDADARLIAAAPDLLEALKDVLNNARVSQRRGEVNRAREAIAKAEGK